MTFSSRAVRVLPVVLSAVLLLPGLAPAQDHSIEGAWLLREVTDAEGTTQAQPGLILFTSTHYSLMIITSPEPRGTYDEEAGMTDEERTHAYNTLFANSGRYTLDGGKLTTRAYVAKDMNYMAAFPENEAEFRVVMEGDMLHLTIGADNEDGGTTLKLERVEGMPME